MKNWHHIRFYFFIFASLGLISPYLGWWLASVLPEHDLKYVLSAFYATLIIVPSVWGHAAFSGQHPGKWLSHGALAAVIFAVGLSQISSSIGVAAACFLIMAFGIFFNPLLPLLEAMAYNQLSDHGAYSKIRLFGSLGFMLCSSLLGGVVLINHPNFFPWMVAALLLISWLFSLPYKKLTLSIVPPTSVDVPKKNIYKSLNSLSTLWIATALTQAAFACYFAFMALHMRSLGVNGWVIGLIIGASAASEILSFWKMDWFFKKAGPWTLIAVASLLSALRWIVVAFAAPGLIGLVLIAQLTQAIGFSVFHTACLKIIHDNLPSTHMGAAQGFYNAVGYGVGGLSGVFIGGIMWEMYGGQGVFLFAMCMSLLAFFLAAGLSLKSRHAQNAVVSD